MSQKSIELILFRQIGNYLSQPMIIINSEGILAFYNDATEKIHGKSFSEVGEIPLDKWSVLFKPRNKNGKRISPKTLPLYTAFTAHHPAQGEFYIKNLRGETYKIEAFAFPIISQIDGFLGAISLFQETMMC